jgi:2-dehydro-3-deoxy-L-rhamnonate dehydrogenase (NAD+)
MSDLQGKAALVTGGSRGLGAAIAVALADERADVAVTYVSAPEKAQAVVARIEAAGRRGLAVRADSARAEDVIAAVERTAAELGRLDVLVNNAGIAGPNATTWEYPPDAWSQVMAINVDGLFFCCRAIVPGMIAQNYGRIVNIASIAGKEGNAKAPAYSVSKAGVIALTKSLGKELATYDISVNCITPAAAKTAIFDQLTSEFIDFMLSKIPRGRFVEVDEIAALVAFCASADCSFTTGAVFDISGGRATY